MAGQHSGFMSGFGLKNKVHDGDSTAGSSAMGK